MQINRNKFNYLSSNLEQPNVLILLGARQVGKSTLMGELRLLAIKLKRPVRSFNLEFPDDLLFFNRSEVELFRDLSSVPNTVIFIDEFHYLKDAGKLFKGIFDLKKNIKIVASGSSSIEIHKHLKESLAGRRDVVEIFPLSLDEWSQQKIPFDDYLIYGGLPGLVHLTSREEKIEYLSQMVQTYILKDIRSLIREENIRAFNHLLFFLAENQGSVLPTSNMASEIGVTQKTVDHYLSILEQTFVVYGVHSYSSKLANELKKSKKYYFYDLGIRNSLVKNFAPINNRDDVGVLFESLVFQELKKRMKANTELRFWRTKQGDEVDFLWIEDRIVTPIEVKSNATNDRPPTGIIKFLKNYPKSKVAYVVNGQRNEDVSYDNYIIRYRTPDLFELRG